MTIITGGTFDKIHKGHKALLDKAIELAYIHDERLLITITSDEEAQKKSHPVTPYTDRTVAVECYILDQMLCVDYKIYKLDIHPSDKILKELDSASTLTMVVSEETYSGAIDTMHELNIPMTIVIIPMVKANDGEKISSTRVRDNQIDIDGKMR